MNKNYHNCLNIQGTDFTSVADFGMAPNSVHADLTSSFIETVEFNYT